MKKTTINDCFSPFSPFAFVSFNLSRRKLAAFEQYEFRQDNKLFSSNLYELPVSLEAKAVVVVVLLLASMALVASLVAVVWLVFVALVVSVYRFLCHLHLLLLQLDQR